MARVRRILGGAKVGHAGTLDPDATGVLVLCLGKATKLSAFLMESTKVYAGVARLGVTTDTQDASGKVLRERRVDVNEAALREAARRFVGPIEQIPPMFSAVKVEGQKLYRLARRGVEIERAPRPVFVHAFDIGTVTFPEFEFSLSCSKGTYVRTILHDLGEALGTGGHLVRLSREAQGGFRRDAALPFAALDAPDADAAIRRAKVSPDVALATLPGLEVGETALPLVMGAAVPAGPPQGPGTGLVRLLGGGRLLGLARGAEDGLRVVHVFGGAPPHGRARRTP